MATAFQACPNRQMNNERCTCAYADCARHGVCCQCVHYHLDRKELPQCFVKAGV